MDITFVLNVCAVFISVSFVVVEFSHGNMNKAVTMNRTFSSFINTANAYVCGELPSQPINETYLLYR